MFVLRAAFWLTIGFFLVAPHGTDFGATVNGVKDQAIAAGVQAGEQFVASQIALLTAFLPSLWRVLACGGLRCDVHYGEPIAFDAEPDRKALARDDLASDARLATPSLRQINRDFALDELRKTFAERRIDDLSAKLDAAVAAVGH